MSSYTDSRPSMIADGHAPDGHAPEFQQWRDATRVVLQPIAAPSVLGLFGFATATFMVAAHIAGWYGSTRSPVYLFEFAAIVGGVAQLIASVWSFRARDVVASAIHGLWGSFWLGYGLLFLLAATHDLTVPSGKFPELAFWFFPLAVLTAMGALAVVGKNLALMITLAALAAGAALLGIGYLIGSSAWLHTGGWVLVADAIAAAYTGSAMMLAASGGRVILPLGEPKADANIPGRILTHPIQYAEGEPGVKQGQ